MELLSYNNKPVEERFTRVNDWNEQYDSVFEMQMATFIDVILNFNPILGFVLPILFGGGR